MRRRYADLPGPAGSWQLHYRRAGDGAVILLLHPSPLSSAFLAPLAQRLAENFDCIALDTPGYGFSDPLPATWREDGLGAYVRALQAFLDALNIERALVYGSATGAQLALALARRAPERCRGLLLENVALFTPQERDDIVCGYFPSIAATADGAHLRAVWEMASRSLRYFPWYDDSPAADRRGVNPPAALAQAVARDYLLAGDDYDRAYRAAFAHEGIEAFAGLTVPTRVVQWADCILGEYASRLDDAALPDAVALRHAGPGMQARMDRVAAVAAELDGLDPVDARPDADRETP